MSRRSPAELVAELGPRWRACQDRLRPCSVRHEQECRNIFHLIGKETVGAVELRHLNPQTQDFTIP